MSLKKIFQKQIDKKVILTTVTNTFASMNPYDIKVVQFEDSSHHDPKYRFWFTFKKSDDVYCLIKTFTTNKMRFAKIYHNNETAYNSVVKFEMGEYHPPLTETSYLDCNLFSKDIVNFEYLRNNVNWSKGIGDNLVQMDNCLKERIIKAIINSPHTAPDIKSGFTEKYGIVGCQNSKV